MDRLALRPGRQTGGSAWDAKNPVEEGHGVAPCRNDDFLHSVLRPPWLGRVRKGRRKASPGAAEPAAQVAHLPTRARPGDREMPDVPGHPDQDFGGGRVCLLGFGTGGKKTAALGGRVPVYGLHATLPGDTSPVGGEENAEDEVIGRPPGDPVGEVFECGPLARTDVVPHGAEQQEGGVQLAHHL